MILGNTCLPMPIFSKCSISVNQSRNCGICIFWCSSSNNWVCICKKHEERNLYTKFELFTLLCKFCDMGGGGGGGKGLFYSCVSNAITQPFEGYVSSLALTVGNKRGSRGV